MLRTLILFLFFSVLGTPLHAQHDLIVAAEQDLAFFKDPMAIQLRESFKKADLPKLKNQQLREVAAALLDNSYSFKYRKETYSAKLSPSALGKMLSIGNGYSQYENVTGIYLPKGKHVVLVEGIEKKGSVAVWVPNWNRRAPEGINPTKDPKGWGIEKKTFDLTNGVNIIELNDFDGLAYIHYYSDKPELEKPITVHFLNSKVNGYFDADKEGDREWNALLDNAVYPIVDAVGKHLQIVYPVEDCKKYAYGRGKELMENYDRLVALQHQIIGLKKYNRVPKNKILSRVNYNYYMFRDGDGVAYMGTEPGYALNRLIDPGLLLSSGACWGFSHEIGHVHQLRNYFNWAGMGEVSNNIMTMYATTSVGQKSNLSNRNHYQKAQDSIVARQLSYLEDKDFMNRLVPFWQLQLYFTQVADNPDFYPDLFEVFRTQSDNGDSVNVDRNPAVYQLNFVRKACEVSKTDLTEFFEKYGFFKIGNFAVKDYRSAQYVMTQDMVNTCKHAIKEMGFPKPKVDIALLRD